MNAYTHTQRRLPGFALIELPVVITILALVFMAGFGLGSLLQKKKCEKEKATMMQK